jgi:hypothetical protein
MSIILTARYLGAAALLASAASTAIAGGSATIYDGNSEAGFDIAAIAPGSRVGMDRWLVDGVNHMYSQWFWYRADGMTQEARINSLPLVGAFTSNTNFDPRPDTFTARWGAPGGLEFETSFSLQGGSAGSGTADIREGIRITNTSTFQTRTISFFQYCDFDLDSDINDDIVQVLNPNAVSQSDFLSGTTVAETVITPAPTLSEVNLFPTTLGKLDDGLIDNLDGSTGPLLGRRDYTWAFQWNIVLGPGDSWLLSKDKQLIPAPGAIALLGLGGLFAGRRRR